MTDRIYRWKKTLLNSLNDAEYNDNTPIIHDEANIPEVYISEWQNVKTVDQIKIHTDFTAAGFEVV